MLEQAGEVVRRHLALLAANAVQVAAGRLMHEQAAWHVDLHNRHLAAACRGQIQTLYRRRKGRIDGISADFPHQTLGSIQLVQRDADDLAPLVLDAQHEDTAVAVGKRRQAIGDILSVRRLHPLAGKEDLLVL